MLDQCSAAREVCEGIDGRRGGGPHRECGEVADELDAGQEWHACSGHGTRVETDGGDARFVAPAIGGHRRQSARSPVRPRQAACGRSVASAAPPARFSALTIALIDAVTMFSSMPTP